jgi:hypothetical protein
MPIMSQVLYPSPEEPPSPKMLFTSIQASEALLPESVLPSFVLPQPPNSEQGKSEYDSSSLESSGFASASLHFNPVEVSRVSDLKALSHGSEDAVER